MELYSGVTSGVGQLVILGELDPTKTNVPVEFQDTYNVRFVGNIVIDTEIPNTEPIRFFNVPRLTVKEDIRPNIILPESDAAAETSITGVGNFFGGTKSGLDYGVDDSDGGVGNPDDNDGDSDNDDDLGDDEWEQGDFLR